MNKSLTVGDKLKRMISEHLQERTESELPPMIGAFSLVAEFTNDEGHRQYLCLTDANLPPWQEIGLLETRLNVLKSRWPETETVYGEDGR